MPKHFKRISGIVIIGGKLVPAQDNVSDIGSGVNLSFNNLWAKSVGTEALSLQYQLKLGRIQTKTANYGVSSWSDTTILANSIGGAFTLTLPAISGSYTGAILIIKKISADVNIVTIDGNGAETIDGAVTNTEIDAQYDCLILMMGESEWHIIGRYIH